MHTAECASAQRDTHTQAVVGVKTFVLGGYIRNERRPSAVLNYYMARFTHSASALVRCAIIFSGTLLATTMESGNVSSNALFATAKHSVRRSATIGFEN